MIRRIYWGLAILAIMIVGFVAFQIYRHIDLTNRLKDVPSIVTETPTTPDVIINDVKPIDVPEDDPIQPIEPHEEQTAEVPHEDSQQRVSVENVTVENYLEGLTDIDLFESITIPTDAELASYNGDEILAYVGVLHKAQLKEDELTDKVNKQILAVSNEMRDDKIGNTKRKKLADQHKELWLIRKDLREQYERLNLEEDRVLQRPGRF